MRNIGNIAVNAHAVKINKLLTFHWAAQLKATVQNHQLCLAHLLRELIFLEESEKLPFATSFKELIILIFDTRKTLIQAHLLNSIKAIAFANTHYH